MSEATDKFRRLWQAKVDAHETCREARQRGFLARLEGRDRDAESAESDHEAAHGVMKSHEQDAMTFAEQYVAENRGTLDFFLGARDMPEMVRLIDAYRAVGDEENATLATMYEIAKFTRQTIGSSVEYEVRQGF